MRLIVATRPDNHVHGTRRGSFRSTLRQVWADFTHPVSFIMDRVKQILMSTRRTAIWLAQELTDAKFTVDEDADGTHIIRCDGIGYSGQMQADPAS